MAEIARTSTARTVSSHQGVVSRGWVKAVAQGVIYVLLLLVAIWTIVPLLWAFAGSFSPTEKVFQYVFPFTWRAFIPVDFTLEAYVGLSEYGFGRAVVNTLILGVFTVVVGGIANAMAGFAFARFDFRGKELLFGLILVTFMVPYQVTLIPLYIMIGRLGWINTWQALLLPGLANSMTIFLFRQFFAEIPQDLLDAARVDGASWPRVLTEVILPISQPILITASLVTFLGQWNSFFWPLLVAPKDKFRVVQVAISFAREQYWTEWNRLLAGSVVAALVPILLVLPFQRYYVQGIAATGLKE
jgi:ABC-type glycerol-3-phosphate transport system permease component